MAACLGGGSSSNFYFTLPMLGFPPNPDDYKDVFEERDHGGMRNIESMFNQVTFWYARSYITKNAAVGILDLVLV